MEYNVETTRIFFVGIGGGIGVCVPSGVLDVETTALRDLPNGTPYWIIDFGTKEAMDELYPPDDFFDAHELDQEALGPPHGIALGYEEWAKLQLPGTPGL